MRARAIFLFFLLLQMDAFYARPTDVRDWGHAEVKAWVKSLDLDPAVATSLAANFKQAGVIGKVLLWVDDFDLQEDFEITSALQRKVIMAGIQALYDEGGSRYSETPQMTFWEIMSSNRKITTWIVGLLPHSPRYAISKLKELPAHAQQTQEAPGWLEYLLIPEYYIFANRATILGGLPGTMWLGVLTKLILRVVLLVAESLKDGLLKAPLCLILSSLITESIFAFGNSLYINYLWPFIPWFICDLFLSCSVYFGGIISLAVDFATFQSMRRKYRATRPGTPSQRESKKNERRMRKW